MEPWLLLAKLVLLLVLTHTTVTGTASTYNPSRKGERDANMETSSGDRYDPHAWTAAIQIDLRYRFGGVRFGRNYKPAYALVESGGKRAIVKINDVGTLRPGRVIDLSDRVMRYFDPSMQLGLIRNVRVTLLVGKWKTGPVANGVDI